MSESRGAVVFNGLLYCFHQGLGQNGHLWYNIFDDSNWLGDVQVPNTGMSKSRSGAVLNGVLYCLHQGAYQDGQLWYNVLAGNAWRGDAQVPETGIPE